MTRKPIIFLCLFAAILYSITLKKDIPILPEPDEYDWVLWAINMASSGNLNPGWFGHPGSTVLYPLVGIYYFLLGTNLQAAFTADPTWFYLLGRSLSAFYALLSIPLLYALGEKLWNRECGTAAAFLFTFYLLPFEYAGVIRSDSAGTFFTLLSLLMIVQFQEVSTKGSAFAAGIAVGLAIATRYFLAALFPALLAAILLKKYSAAKTTTFITAALFGCFLAFFFTTPFALLDLHTLRESMQYEMRHIYLGADGLSFFNNLLWHIKVAIPFSATAMQSILAVGGMTFVLHTYEEKMLPLFVFALCFLFAISFPLLHFGRWVVQLLPLVALFCAFFLQWIAKIIMDPLSMNEKTVFIVLVMLVSIVPMTKVLISTVQMTNPSTRIIAREWIEQNIPKDASIVHEYHTMLLPEWNAITVESLSDKKTLDYYREQEVEYLIASSKRYGYYFQNPIRYEAEKEFYTELFSEGTTVREFSPTLFTRGANIIIFTF